MHIQFSLSLHFYLFYLLLIMHSDVTILVKCETVQLHWQETPDFISPDLCPPDSLDLNPDDYRIWRLMQKCMYTAQDTSMIMTAAVPQWHMGKHITKYHWRSSWSMEKVVTCKHEGERTSLWTSAKLKSLSFQSQHTTHRHRHSTKENTLFCVISIAAI